MIDLDIMDILGRTVPPLAKKLGCTKERAWEILNNDFPNDLLYNIETSQYRNKVNIWWPQYHSILSSSLGVCSKAPSPSKLPPPTYKQIMCLTWLTEKLKTEQIQRSKRIYEETKPRTTPWQRFTRWIKIFFKKVPKRSEFVPASLSFEKILLKEYDKGIIIKISLCSNLNC